MKVLNNKKGSAMLWTILLVVIITILLSAVMTATYAYFNYTMYTVRRQQAYFTARSAISALVDEFSSQEDNDPSELLPDRNSSVEITSFSFPEKMGTATAVLTREDKDEVTIKATGVYAGEEYTITSTVVKQPLYFAGIAIKNLTLNGNLSLGDNTDLYYNNTETFDLRATNFNLNLKGSLVTKGDAIIKSGTTVAGHKFDRDVRFSNTSSQYSRKIWTSSEYVLSNKTLYVADGVTEYESSVINTMSNIGNYTLKYCNNTKNTYGSYFGFPSLADLELMQGLMELIGLSNIYTDIKNSSMSLTDSSGDALSIKYIKLLSLTNTINEEMQEWKEDGNWLEKIIAGGYDVFFEDIFVNYGFSVFDVSYIEYMATDETSREDSVIPIVYMFADKGLTIRVKYGKDPAKESNLFDFVEGVGDTISGFINNVFQVRNNMSYVIIYMEPNSTVELGCKVGGRNDNPEDLVFAYSIYGGDNTKVILNSGVTVLGEIFCDTLEVNGDAEVIYTNSSGSQIAKQKVAEFWTVSNYSD